MAKYFQPGFGYQQPLVPGMRPGGAPFFMPFVQQGQQGPRPGGGRRTGPGGHMQQSQQPMPMVQQQVFIIYTIFTVCLVFNGVR